jgi:DNA repair protein RadC
MISIGSLNASIVHPREVYRPAIVLSAASLVLAHNHPSGDTTPSEEDLAITRRLHEAGRLLGIELVDHIVVAKDGYTSLRERKLL